MRQDPRSARARWCCPRSSAASSRSCPSTPAARSPSWAAPRAPIRPVHERPAGIHSLPTEVSRRSNPLPAENRNGLVVTAETAADLDLRTDQRPRAVGRRDGLRRPARVPGTRPLPARPRDDLRPAIRVVPAAGHRRTAHGRRDRSAARSTWACSSPPTAAWRATIWCSSGRPHLQPAENVHADRARGHPGAVRRPACAGPRRRVRRSSPPRTCATMNASVVGGRRARGRRGRLARATTASGPPG